VIETWRRHYNTIKPHSSLRYQLPAPEVLQWSASQLKTATPVTHQLAKKRNPKLTYQLDRSMGSDHLFRQRHASRYNSILIYKRK